MGCAADRQGLCLLVSRLEERESEMKKEYNALHQRHTEVGAQPRPAHEDVAIAWQPCCAWLLALAGFSGVFFLVSTAPARKLSVVRWSDSTP